MFYILLLITFLLPQISLGADTTGSLQSLLSGIGGFINSVLIPFILGIAFLIFVVNVVRFFIIGSHDPEGQKNARYLALYSIGAFVFILTFWGIVNFLINGIGFNNKPCSNDTTSDYITSDLAPCTSIVPPSRPPSSVPPSVVDTAPTLIPPSPVIDAPPTLPSADTPPTMTPPPSLGTTPTPNIPDFTPVATLEQSIRTSVSQYVNNEMEIDFGANTDIIKDNLLADFASAPDNSVSTVETAKAINRFVKLGVLPESTLTDYLSVLGTYNEQLGLDDTGLATAVQNLAVPMPNTLKLQMNSTRNDVIDTLYDWDSRNTPELLASELFDNSLTTDTRLENFRQYYTEGDLYDRFVHDLNAEKIFAGEFDFFE